MIYKNEKIRFFKILVNDNIREEDFFTCAKTNGVAVPVYMLKIWKHKFYITKHIPYPRTPRLINRFSIGADPEFAFTHPLTGKYIYAGELGLDTLKAFGCDMSTRQVELRAYPSRFVLDIVASLIDTLRWMAICEPSVCAYNWQANGLVGVDGCGGHIHFGRKRGTTQKEIYSLDSLSNYLIHTQSLIGAKERSQQTNYGHPNDFRQTSYGYEFRGISTWLNTPFLAYLILTLAKLSIFHDISKVHFDRFNDPTFVENLLATYRYQDDDANIAFIALRNRNSLVSKITNMKDSWGIISNIQKRLNQNLFVPPIIPPDENTKAQLFDYLVNKVELPKIIPKLTWNPLILKPNEYILSIAPHIPGLSEVGQGLISRDIKFNLTSSNNPQITSLRIPLSVMKDKQFLGLMRGNGINTKNIQVYNTSNKVFNIELSPMYINRQNPYIVDVNKVKKHKQLLLSGIFPIVDYKDYDKLSKVGKLLEFKTPKLRGQLI